MCSACLARHHGDCWEEVGRCAGCSSSTALVDPEKPAGERTASGSVRSRRSRLWRLRKPPRPPSSVFVDFVASLFSLGFAPAFLAETRLIELLRPEVVKETREQDRYAAVEGRVRPSALIREAMNRRIMASAVFCVAAFAALAGAVAFDGPPDMEGVGIWLWVHSGTVWAITLLVHLAAHHRAVRRYDASQLVLRADAKGVSEAATEALLARYEIAWGEAAGRLHRWTWGAALFSTLCFPFAYVIFPLWIARAFQIPMELHRRREQLRAFG